MVNPLLCSGKPNSPPSAGRPASVQASRTLHLVASYQQRALRSIRPPPMPFGIVSSVLLRPDPCHARQAPILDPVDARCQVPRRRSQLSARRQSVHRAMQVQVLPRGLDALLRLQSHRSFALSTCLARIPDAISYLQSHLQELSQACQLQAAAALRLKSAVRYSRMATRAIALLNACRWASMHLRRMDGQQSMPMGHTRLFRPQRK